MPLSTLLSEAKLDYQAGRFQDARQKLSQAVRLNPQNYKLWLALAKVSESPQERLATLKRAQKYHPQQPEIQKALHQLTLKPAKAKKASFSWPRPFLFIATTLLLLVIFFVLSASWISTRSNQQALPAPLTLASLPENSISPQTAKQPVTAPATATVQPLNGKQLIVQAAPRATWTVTSTPSPTPTNTPTVLPTFVSSNAYTQAVRPFGVGNNERWIDINLFTQTLKAYEGDQLVFSTLVSSGTVDHQTVTGQFRIWLRFESQTMDGRRLGYDYYIENVPHVMYFFEDYAIHGAYWHNNFGNPMSHGCVNVAPNDAQWLFNWANLGTWVNVHY